MRRESIRVTAVVGFSLTFMTTLRDSISSDSLPKVDSNESKLPGDPPGEGGNSVSSNMGVSLMDSTSD